MKKYVFATLVLALAVPFGFGGAQEKSDHDAVRQAVLDYVEGVYHVEPARIERSVHPQLAKLGFYRPPAAAAYNAGRAMTFAQLIEVAKTWNKDGKLRKDAPKEITVFEVQDQTASAKLVAEWGTDYFHLAKFDGKWMIVNVLWQSPPKKSAAPQQ
ncbi:MAG TPA: nuclear transport factor 2 family protein [Blastocatellia bacterium]|nr:nuclear transport factor 2 family protein [Blastocatellia bacterium]